MNNPLVSIIIPVYNVEKYLEETINSAVNQTWANKEIIIVDDGSVDNSLAIARQYENSWIKVFAQPNKGASATRNKGLREAKGDYIQFLDADDILGFNKIENQIKLLTDQIDSIAFGCTVYFQDDIDLFQLKLDSRESRIYEPIDFLLKLYGGKYVEPDFEGMIQPNSWLAPRGILDSAGSWNEKLTLDDDGEYFCRAVLESKRVIFVPNAVNYYRKYETNSNLSARKDVLAMKSALLATELKYKYLKAKSDSNLINTAFAKLFKENAVTFYPEFRDLYLIADKRVEELGGINYIPIVGGKYIELIKKKIGWKAAKWILFTTGRLRQYLRTKTNNCQ